MDAQLANMIAAGEVVERPASVVKELVENALDAASTKIEIHVQDSGVRQIKIIDNGVGMNHFDAKMAFLRHATSKLKSAHDIMRINTLGFRGEALPSIAAVADVHLKTADGQNAGYHLHLKGGNVVAEQPFAMRKGTQIEVNQLFFNTPARLKYLKSLNTELSHITDYIAKTALAHEKIAITLTNNHREVLKTPGATDIKTVISRVYGFDIAKKMHQLAGGNDDFKITGLISSPEITRATRNYITLIVNNRPIKNYELVRTVVEAYHTYLPKDRFPIVVINIKLDPLLVDVNVHPAKTEVRFSKEEALKSFILTEIQKTLSSLTYIPKPTLATTTKPAEVAYQQPSLLTNQQVSQQFATPNSPLPSQANYQGNAEVSAKKLEIREAPGAGYSVAEEIASATKKEATPKTFTNFDSVKTAKPSTLVQQEAKPEVVVALPSSDQASLELYYIGQLHGTYLLAQNAEGLFLIDQHAAMERVEYEKYYPLLGAVGAERMELLVPLALSYPVGDLVRVKEDLPRLQAFGFEIEEFGASDLVIRTAPVWAVKHVKQVAETLINTLLGGREIAVAKLREAVAIMMSCQQSVKANQYLNEAAVRGLLANLCQCEQPYTCPHGRPIIVKLTKYEIARLFKRV